MGVISIFRSAFDLFKDSFSKLIPLILIGAVNSAFIISQSHNFDGFGLFGWILYVCACGLSMIIHICLILSAYYHFTRQSFDLSAVFSRGISRFLSIIWVYILLLVPSIVVTFIVMIPITLLGIFFCAVFLESNTWELYLELLTSLSIIIGVGVSLYSVLLYAYVAEMTIVTKNQGAKASLSQSKLLVHGRKRYVGLISLLIFLIGYISHYVLNTILNDVIAAALNSIITAPFIACVVAVFYDSLLNHSRQSHPA